MPQAQPVGGEAGLAHRAEQLEIILDVGTKLASNMDLDELLALVVEQTTRVMNADRSSLFLVDAERNELWSKVAQGTEEIRIPLGTGIAGHVASTGDVINIPDAYADPRFNQEVDKATGYRTRSILCAPLMTRQGEIIGALQILNKHGGVFEDIDEDMLHALTAQVAVAIQNARYHQESLQQERLRRDLEVAHSVQESFLPQELPAIPGFTCSATYRSAQEVGGDFYDFIPLAGDHWAIVVGDVSGKGVPAALFMAKLMSDIRYLAQVHDDPSDILGALNDLIVKRSHRGMFVTLVCAFVRANNPVIKIASGGHLPPLAVASSGDIRRLEVDGGSPLGILAGQSFGQVSITLEPGEHVLFYTDGLLEARNVRKEEFGFERIEGILRMDRTSDDLTGKLVEAVGTFQSDATQHDDLTLVSLRLEDVESESSGPRLVRPEQWGTVSFTLPAHPAFLALARKTLTHLISDLGLTDKEIRTITLAVDEAHSNILKYAYKGDTDNVVDFTITTEPGKVTVVLRDYGDPVEVAAIQGRDLDDVRPGGLGTHFIQDAMDAVTYEANPDGPGTGGTRLTLVKKL